MAKKVNIGNESQSNAEDNPQHYHHISSRDHHESHGDSHTQHEAWYANIKRHHDLHAANDKRTYDEYQDIAVTQARRSQINHDQLNQVSLQALQNAVETANMVGKQAFRAVEDATERKGAVQNQTHRIVDDLESQKQYTAYQANRHADLAMDRQWNMTVQQGVGEGHLVGRAQLDDASTKAIAAEVARAMSETRHAPSNG